MNWHFIAPPNPTVEKSLGIVRCSVCSRPLTDPESVAAGIGPVCKAHGVAKHMGPRMHPSGSPQSVHGGGGGKMDWKKSRRGQFFAETATGTGYTIIPKKDGTFFIKAFLAGGAERRLPFKNFTSAEKAKQWVEEYEAKRAKERARRKKEKPIRF